MHYIIGTSFTVRSNNISGTRYGRLFKPNTSYRILHLIKADEGMTYVFQDQNGNRHDVTFNSCRDADNFIGSCRSETIPDYDKIGGVD